MKIVLIKTKTDHDAENLINIPGYLEMEMEKGKNFQEILGWTNELLLKFYTYACELYDAQKYEEAEDIFLLITFINPEISNGWLSLGMAEHKNQKFISASNHYEIALSLDPLNPWPYIYSAQCYLSLKSKEGAAKVIDLLEAVNSEIDDSSAIEEIKQIKELLSNK